jgi:hypothetical protein
MAGINLSQSIQEKQAIARGSFFDKGFFVNTAIFLLVAGLYGGSQWYLGTLEEELATLQGDAATKTVGLKNKEADRAADLSTRLKAIAVNLESGTEPKDALQELEQLTIANIKLTGYRYQEGERLLIVRGVTTNLKYLAQQMLSYKKLTGVSSVHAESVKYNDAGLIEFELQLPLDAPVAAVPATP